MQKRLRKPGRNQNWYSVFSLCENSEIVWLCTFFLERLRVQYTIRIIIIIYNTRHVVCTFHNLRAVTVRDDLHAFAQKPNAVVCSITVGTHNNTIYIVLLLLLLSPRSYPRDIYGISLLADEIPTMYYIILLCCAVMISLAIRPCRCSDRYLPILWS